jgi:hypothetical protein
VHLVEIIKTTENETHQILATQGCINLLNESEFPAKKKIRLFRNLFGFTNRIEEKKRIIAGLSKIKTEESLRFVTSLLHDADVKTEAALAVVTISSSKRNEPSNLTSSQVALVLAGSGAADTIVRTLENQFSQYSGLNQAPKGFTALFNGRDLTGWKGLVENPIKRAQMSAEELIIAQAVADELMHEHWKVENGILVFDGKGHSLCTANDYGNFELWVDWKIQKGGDSGIYLRGSPQVQIWDPAQWPEGSGGLYNNQKNPNKPLELADNPIGEWNQFRILMIDDRVTVYLNDVLVVENVVMENYWERDKPIYPTGQIELQAHSTPLYFRNIFIKEIPKKKEWFAGDLFNGKDLTGWQSIGRTAGGWKVEDKILFTDGEGGGWLSTEKEYDNFILDLDFRVPPGGNSGVFLRAPHKGDPAYTGMEIQVLDDYAEKYNNLNAWQYTGSVYGIQAPSTRVSKKADQWQHMTIYCNGPEVKVTLNETLIIDTNLISHLEQESSHPGLKRRKGYIGLQNHSTKIEYRNIKIKELE